MVSQISREQLKVDTVFNYWATALRWKDVLAARVIMMYVREARNNFEGNDYVGENQDLTTGSTAMQMNSTLSTLAGGLRKSTDSGCGCSFARALAAAGSTKSTSALAASPVSKKPRFRS